jgi:hypothetical protein
MTRHVVCDRRGAAQRCEPTEGLCGLSVTVPGGQGDDVPGLIRPHSPERLEVPLHGDDNAAQWRRRDPVGPSERRHTDPARPAQTPHRRSHQPLRTGPNDATAPTTPGRTTGSRRLRPSSCSQRGAWDAGRSLWSLPPIGTSASKDGATLWSGEEGVRRGKPRLQGDPLSLRFGSRR